MLNLIKTDKCSRFGRAVLSVFLSAAVLLTALGVITVIPAMAQTAVWDGTKTAPVDSDDDGTYEINNASELAYVINTSGGEGKNYKLTEDIYLNDVNKINWSNGSVDDGTTVRNWYTYWENPTFTGNIDGDGHIVYGLYFDQNPSSYVTGGYGSALIPAIAENANVTIKNLGVDKVFFDYEGAASAFVGDLKSGATVSFEECFVGDAYIKGGNAGAFCGYTASNTTVNITNCYSLAETVVNDGYVGGLAGIPRPCSTNTVIKNSYNANGPVMSTYWTNAKTLENCYQTASGDYNTGALTLEAPMMKGNDVFTDASKMPNLNTDSVFTATDSYPILTVFGAPIDDGGDEDEDEEETIVDTDEFGNWNGVTKAPLDSDEDGVYEISRASELAYVIKVSGGQGKAYKLTADIYLNDVAKINWETGEAEDGYTVNSWYGTWGIPEFSGTIDGDGHTVYGLYMKGTESYERYTYGSALIPVTAADTTVIVKNLGINDAYINYENTASALVGVVKAGTELSVENCYVGGNVFLTANDVGVMVGYLTDTSSATVTNSYSLATNDAKGSEKGGFVGVNKEGCGLVIKNCYNGNGAVLSQYYCLNRQVSDSYQTVDYAGVGGVVTLASRDMVGADALTASNKMATLNSDNAYIATAGFPKLKLFENTVIPDISLPPTADELDAAFFGEGSGTESDPYIIKTVSHLRYLVESQNTYGKYYKLANDIKVNETSNKNWTDNNPSEWYSSADQRWYFEGTLDGNGHTIYGLYVNEKPDPTPDQIKAGYVSHGTGLFPLVSTSATIRSLHIRDSYLSGLGCVGAFAGRILVGDTSLQMQFIGCSVDESVKLHGYTVGGLLGAGDKGVDLRYCYSTAKLTTEGKADRTNGLIGEIWSAQVNMLECYTVGYKITYNLPHVSYRIYSDVSHEIGTTLSTASMLGAKAKKSMKDFSWDTVWYTAEGKTPQLKVIPVGQEEPIIDEGVKGRAWSGKLATKYAGGSGTEADPYLIETPEQLALIFDKKSDEFTYYKLTADIILNDTSKKNWQETAYQWFDGRYIFRGVFDGNGHVVSGLYYCNEANTDGSDVGLFQRLGYNSVIKRLGVTDSTIINVGKDETMTFAAAIVGYLEQWEPDKYPERKAPVISECFADDSVYVKASAAGGIISGVQTLIEIKNCYFTGTLEGSMHNGAIVGDAWAGDERGPHIENCYAVTSDYDAIADGYAFTSRFIKEGKTVFKNAYVDGALENDGPTQLSVLFMHGKYAKEKLQGFNWNTVWKACDDGTPVLRCFEDAEDYTSKREARKIEISFSNLGNIEVESIYGYAGYTPISVDTLPKPERMGFLFNGWYHFNPNGAPFELTVFPNRDITLYANWTEVGFTTSFDNDLDPQYDYNEGIEVYRPGLDGYDPSNIYGGWRSLHALSDSKVEPRFVISYENPLTVGNEYVINFWMAADADGTDGTIYFDHSNYADVNDVIVGYEEAVSFTGLKKGEWKKYSVTVIANAPYILVRSSLGAGLFFDSFEVIPTGRTGELGNIQGYSPSNVGAEPEYNGIEPWLIAVIIGGAALVLLGAFVIVILVKKKKIRK